MSKQAHKIAKAIADAEREVSSGGYTGWDECNKFGKKVRADAVQAVIDAGLINTKPPVVTTEDVVGWLNDEPDYLKLMEVSEYAKGLAAVKRVGGYLGQYGIEDEPF